MPEYPIQNSSQQQLPQQQEDPFNVDRYRNVMVPDAPMGHGQSVAEALLNDNEVPEEIRKKWWSVFHKDNSLTFLTAETKSMKLLNFDIMKLDTLFATPFEKYDFEMELEMGVMRNALELKLDRSMGTTQANCKNERIILQTQFQENRMIQENGGEASGGGFFKRLLGRR